MLPGTWAYVSAGAFGRAIIVSFTCLSLKCQHYLISTRMIMTSLLILTSKWLEISWTFYCGRFHFQPSYNVTPTYVCWDMSSQFGALPTNLKNVQICSFFWVGMLNFNQKRNSGKIHAGSILDLLNYSVKWEGPT